MDSLKRKKTMKKRKFYEPHRKKTLYRVFPLFPGEPVKSIEVMAYTENHARSVANEAYNAVFDKVEPVEQKEPVKKDQPVNGLLFDIKGNPCACMHACVLCLLPMIMVLLDMIGFILPFTKFA